MTTSSSTWALTVGHQHPAAHGPVVMELETRDVDGHIVITTAHPVIYPMHRGAEKLFESRDYQQLLSLADRHDWLSSFGSELGLALTVEEMLGISVPERATWIRTMMAELNRLIHHLRWLGESAPEVVGNSPKEQDRAAEIQLSAREVREKLTLLHEAASGGRLHPMLVAYGGVKHDLPDNWGRIVIETLSEIDSALTELASWWAHQTHLAGKGLLDLATAVEYAVSGPVARASGSPLDLRLTEPYLAYGELSTQGILRAVTAADGDVYSRFNCLANELRVSRDIVLVASDRLAAPALAGPVNVRLPRKIRVPEGAGYGWTENPTGINGWYLISTGGPTPERLKLRTASFANAQALCQVLVDTDVEDLATTMLSFLLISGDLAK